MAKMKNEEFCLHTIKDGRISELSIEIVEILYKNKFESTAFEFISALTFAAVNVAIMNGVPKYNLLNNVSEMYEYADPENRT